MEGWVGGVAFCFCRLVSGPEVLNCAAFQHPFPIPLGSSFSRVPHETSE